MTLRFFKLKIASAISAQRFSNSKLGDQAAVLEEARLHKEIQNAARGVVRADHMFKTLVPK